MVRIDVAAPGSSISSTIPYNGYDTKSGTSMSAPMVAGLLGLMKSFSPNASNDQLISCMKNSCNNIGANPSYAGLLGSGKLMHIKHYCVFSQQQIFMLEIKTVARAKSVFDATLGIPNSWAWDFESDGIIDDTNRTATRYFNQSEATIPPQSLILMELTQKLFRMHLILLLVMDLSLTVLIAAVGTQLLYQVMKMEF